MSNLRAFNHTVNIVAYNKNEINYGASIAWAMQVDYDKLLLLMGCQSVTGNNIEVGDKIGVSALSINQKHIAMCFGDGHSDEKNKFVNVNINQNESAITIQDASREMICEVMEIVSLKEIEEDRLIYVKVLSYKENNDQFLNYIAFLETESAGE